MPRVRLFALALSACLAARAGAQPSYLELQPGTRVRVGLDPELRGTVLSRSRDSLVIAAGRAGQQRLAIANLRNVEVYRGRSRSSGAWRGTLWGGGIGLLIGFLSESDSSVNHPAFAAYMGFNGALIGASVGAIAGRERWVAFGEQAAGTGGVIAGVVTPGTRVRVTAPGAVGPGFIGTLLEQRPDSIRVSGEGGVPVTIPVSAVQRIERSAGKNHTYGAFVGAGWGALITGLGFGLLSAAANEGHDMGEAIGTGAAGGAFWGAIIGAAVGQDAWREVSPVTALVPGPRGARVLNVGLRMRVN